MSQKYKGHGTDVLSTADISAEDFHTILRVAADAKAGTYPQQCLAGKSVAMLFQFPSLRTRASFEVAINRLGGHVFHLANDEIWLDKGESIPDVAQVLSRYVDLIVARLRHQKDLQELAQFATVPVINALTQEEHTCQVLGDLLTVQEVMGRLQGVKVVFVGDGNNVCRSWWRAAWRCGVDFTLVAPPGYECYGFPVSHDLDDVAGADIIYTDAWASMGMEDEHEARIQVFTPYQVNEALLARAPTAKVMHCLPAYRGEEITDAVMDGPQSVIFDQAENRMWAQMALLSWVMRKVDRNRMTTGVSNDRTLALQGKLA